jgi:twitching motility two-component system response regulator PilG
MAVADVFEQTQNAYVEDEIPDQVQVPVDEMPEVNQDVDPVDEAEGPALGVSCPFCQEDNDTQVFECRSCKAVLTLSDINGLVSANADRTVVQRAVTQMEAEWNLREFNADELISLGIGHFNLGNSSAGVRYLQEASLLRPNDVILSGHINALVIRIDELRRQNESKESRPKGRTILVVDDSATVRKLIAGKLEKSGHNVVCAEDGIEGLTRLAEQRPDLVLLDITMPRMDGYEVCRQIRSNPETKDIPVVMISGKDGFFDKVRGRMAGTTAYITKPFGPETLMKALERYLADADQHVHVLASEEETVAA